MIRRIKYQLKKRKYWKLRAKFEKGLANEKEILAMDNLANELNILVKQLL